LGRYGRHIKKHQADGYTFDSRRELIRYYELKLLEQAGEIDLLDIHPRIKITIGGVDVRYPTGRHMVYVADFKYYDHGKNAVVVEDVKFQSGYRTEVYKIKRALVAAMGIDILET
jgi:hypothetical protein